MLLVVAVVMGAWVHEDAFITLRVADNFVNGYGLRWNVAERVQVFTHPLWLLLLLPLYALLREPWLAVTVLALACTAGAATCLIAIRRSDLSAGLALAILAFTRSFTDWSTGGLENSLSHLLLGLFVWLWLERRSDVLWLSFVASLAMLTRHDTALFYAAPLAAALINGQRLRNVGRAALGALPFVAATLLSLVYYGFPLPNTAYAKLGHGLSRWELFQSGIEYLVYHVTFDLLTILAIVAIVGTALARGDSRVRLVAVGPVLYLLYMVRIGGDYMAGRFWSLPLFCAALLLARWRPKGPLLPGLAVAAAGVAGLGLAPQAALLVPSLEEPSLENLHGINDERRFMYPHTGLLARLRGRSYRGHHWALKGDRLRLQEVEAVAAGTVGLLGYRAGPGVFFVDYYALTDPLLARLPALYDPHWRIGHHLRFIPEGYLETAQSGRSALRDSSLATYWEHLARVTRAPLWSRDRWRSIWLLNTGQLEGLIDKEAYRRPLRRELRFDEMLKPRGLATEDAILREALLPPEGTVIRFAATRHEACLLLELAPTESYTVSLLAAGEVVAQFALPHKEGEAQHNLALQNLFLPRELAAAGYDGLHVRPAGLAEAPSLGSVRFCDR